MLLQYYNNRKPHIHQNYKNHKKNQSQNEHEPTDRRVCAVQNSRLLCPIKPKVKTLHCDTLSYLDLILFFFAVRKTCYIPPSQNIQCAKNNTFKCFFH